MKKQANQLMGYPGMQQQPQLPPAAKLPSMGMPGMGMPTAPHMLGRPGMNHNTPAHMAPIAPPPPPSPTSAAKLGFEYGALHAVKIATRIGSTIPTGYKFNLNDQWLGGLPPDAQSQAKSKAQLVNKWLQENSALGGGYAQNPEFARQMVALTQLAKQKQMQEQVLPKVAGFNPPAIKGMLKGRSVERLGKFVSSMESRAAKPARSAVMLKNQHIAKDVAGSAKSEIDFAERARKYRSS